MKTESLTQNIKVENKDLKKLKMNFPSFFDKNGYFQFDKFKKHLSEKEIDISEDNYSLNWLGKSYARILADEPTRTLLKEDKEHNSKPENINSQNILIKGDNLEVLKHLKEAYHEKIKMIYIDPPYNTGEDFIYKDERKFTVEEFSELANISEEQAKRVLDFTSKGSNSHSAWLTFMYPRLYVAKQLLREDGVIFISIDDNEVNQLKLLLEEGRLFGEENFLGCFVIKSTPNARDYGHIGKMHEYCLMYAKNDVLTKTYHLPDKEKKFTYKDDRGPYNIHPLYNSNEAFHIDNRPNLYYPFYLYKDRPLEAYLNKNGSIENGKFFEIGLEKRENSIEIYPPLSNKNYVQFVWRWGKSLSSENLNTEIVGYKNRNGEYRIVEKMRTAEKVIRSILETKNISTRRGTKEVEEIFNQKIFSFPKPIKLLNDFLMSGLSENDIVLDFFAGSGTTGDALMRLNANSFINRKYILVQLPELIENKGKSKKVYNFVKNKLGNKKPTIFDITKERILRASKLIQEENKKTIKQKYNEIQSLNSELDIEENKEKVLKLENEIEFLKNQDLGFKIFETTPIWEDYFFEEESFNAKLDLFDERKLNEEDIQTLLTTWKTQDQMLLTESLQEVKLDEYISYYGKNKLYLMEKGFTTTDLKVLLEKIDSNKKFIPKTIIAFGYNFESKYLREIAENIKSYANKKGLDIEFIIRY